MLFISEVLKVFFCFGPSRCRRKPMRAFHPASFHMPSVLPRSEKPPIFLEDLMYQTANNVIENMYRVASLTVAVFV